MKKYYICFFVLAVILTAAILTSSYFYLYRPRKEGPIPNTIVESESIMEDNMVINQKQVAKIDEGALGQESLPADELQYCLVAENGFLLVFAKDKNMVCLDTHMPLTEFPEKEQERLMEGIWFSTMMEIFNYLESYSS